MRPDQEAGREALRSACLLVEEAALPRPCVAQLLDMVEEDIAVDMVAAV